MPSVIDVAEWFYDALTRRSKPRVARVIARRLTELPERARVLDLGSGTGRIALEVERGTGVQVTACDIDFDAVRRAVRYPSGGTIVADGCALPFAPDSFAATYLVYVLHHVPDQQKLLAEVQQVLRDQGHLILVEFDAASALVWGFRVLAKLTGRRPCRFHTPASLLGLLRAAGFDAAAYQIDRATFVVTGRPRQVPPAGHRAKRADEEKGDLYGTRDIHAEARVAEGLRVPSRLPAGVGPVAPRG